MSWAGLGPVGVALNVSDTYLGEAAELERSGYTAIWLPGGQVDDLGRLAALIEATRAVLVAPAIISLDVYPPDRVAAFYARLEARAPGRFMPGLGGPQKPRPLRALNDYLDHLDRADPPLPADRRILAALGPRKLELARARSAGAIMLLVTSAYIGTARRILGDHATLIIDQMIVADTDADRARQTARHPLRFLSSLPGYRSSFTRMGFSETDIAEVSDRLVDELVIWGGPDTIAARINERLQAGADHVVLHVLSEGDQPGPAEVASTLASSLVT